MMNQLVSVDDKLNGKVYNYTYDAGGNLISETVTDSNGTTSNAYEYNNSNWGDVLTSYNGQSITYDEIGNPLTYRDGMSMTWKNGRQLATLTNGDTSISYGYDSDSVRTTKTVNGVKYTYAYLNGQLLYETRGDAKFYYSYDANGILYNVRYTLTDGGTEYSYYYTHNSRGDIVGIYNGAGELKAHYEYDAWGNVISITDNNGNAITNPNHIGNLNPFRYRGYYQDTETGLYYLMNRYYDSITHRFINADGYFQAGTTILDGNTFSYCRNNPIILIDPFGTTVYTYGISVSAMFGCVGYTSIFFAHDDYGNYGIFYSITDYESSGGIGMISAGLGITTSVIWDAETIDDLLSKDYQNWGFSVGEGVSVGLDLILLDEYDTPSGISATFGLGIGFDYGHAYTATTVPISVSKSSSSSSSGGKSGSFSTGKGNAGKGNKSDKGNKKGSKGKTQKKSEFRVCPSCGCPHIRVG